MDTYEDNQSIKSIYIERRILNWNHKDLGNQGCIFTALNPISQMAAFKLSLGSSFNTLHLGFSRVLSTPPVCLGVIILIKNGRSPVFVTIGQPGCGVPVNASGSVSAGQAGGHCRHGGC